MKQKQGFTLVEIAIVLVIITLIAGGVLAGRDLIAAGKVRAQVSQIEQYKTKINIFRNKYNGLPGDMVASKASDFGFAAGTGAAGRGNGNGIIERCFLSSLLAASDLGCETMLFWVHLSEARLIAETFDLDGGSVSPDEFQVVLGGSTTLDKFLPAAKIGNGNYVATFAWQYATPNNYFLIAAITDSIPSAYGYVADGTITPAESFGIDSKIDDGKPWDGSVLSTAITDGCIEFTEGSRSSYSGSDCSMLDAQLDGGNCLSYASGGLYNLEPTTTNIPPLCQLLIKF